MELRRGDKQPALFSKGCFLKHDLRIVRMIAKEVTKAVPLLAQPTKIDTSHS